MRIEGVINLLLALGLTVTTAEMSQSSNTVEDNGAEPTCKKCPYDQKEICTRWDQCVSSIQRQRRKRFVHKFYKRLLDRIPAYERPALAGTGDGGQVTHVLVNVNPDLVEQSHNSTTKQKHHLLYST
jgi:hypothetical protein